MKTSARITNALLICTLLFGYGCQKNSDPEPTTEEKEAFAIASTESHSESEIVFNDVFDNVIGVNAEVGIGGTGIFGGASPSQPGTDLPNGPTGTDSSRCFIVTTTHLVQGSTFPVKVEIDFGAGCTGRDGRTRKGKIITTYSARLIFPGARATTTFDNYYVNDVKVEGTHEITNKTSANIPAFEVRVDGKLTKSNGNYSEWISIRNVSQAGGLATPLDPSDDRFSLTGSAQGTVKRGERIYQWSTETVQPLIKKFACRWIIQGNLSFKKGNLVVGTLDYGSGECDNQATLTVNGSARIITLH